MASGWAASRSAASATAASSSAISSPRLRDQVDPTIAAISTMLIVASVILLGSAALLQRKRG